MLVSYNGTAVCPSRIEKMVSRVIFIAFVCIVLGLGLFFLIYGIKGGLIEKRVLTNAWRQQYVTGRDAVIRGWVYIGFGVLFLVVLVSAVWKELNR